MPINPSIGLLFQFKHVGYKTRLLQDDVAAHLA